MSREPLPLAFEQWAQPLAIQDRTGLRPLLLDHWTQQLWPCHPGQIDTLDPEAILLREWHTAEFVGYLDEAAADVAGRAAWRDEIPETAWVPKRPWSAVCDLAWACPARTRGRDPDAVAREVVARNLLPFWLYDRLVCLGLVPAARSADIPAVTGMETPVPISTLRRCRRSCAPGRTGSAPGWWRGLVGCTSRWPPRRC